MFFNVSWRHEDTIGHMQGYKNQCSYIILLIITSHLARIFVSLYPIAKTLCIVINSPKPLVELLEEAKLTFPKLYIFLSWSWGFLDRVELMQPVTTTELMCPLYRYCMVMCTALKQWLLGLMRRNVKNWIYECVDLPETYKWRMPSFKFSVILHGCL